MYARSGYASVGDLKMYYELHGRGPAVVLIHGTFGTIESCFAELLPALAEQFEVIAVELQGHGRTRDIDRAITYPALACDVATLLEIIEVRRAHIVGYSLGGGVALQLAMDRPQLVDRIVFAGGAAFESTGIYPELRAAFDSFDPHQLDGSRWHHAYLDVAPDLHGWIPLVTKVNQLDRASLPWSRNDLAAIKAPALLINGDSDIVQPEHAVAMFRLLGGGVPGDLSGLPSSQLAILPGTTHEGVLERIAWLTTMITGFLRPHRTRDAELLSRR